MKLVDFALYVAVLITVITGAALSFLSNSPGKETSFFLVLIAAITLAVVIGLRWRDTLIANLHSAMRTIDLENAVDTALRAHLPLIQAARQLASNATRVKEDETIDIAPYLSNRFLSSKSAVVGAFSLGMAWLTYSGALNLYSGILALPMRLGWGRSLVVAFCLYVGMSSLSFFFLGLTSRLLERRGRQ